MLVDVFIYLIVDYITLDKQQLTVQVPSIPSITFGLMKIMTKM